MKRDKLFDYLVVGVIFLIILALFGCAPYVEYEHLSDPRVSDDGFDLVCGGVIIQGDLEIHGGVCKDVSGYRGEYVNIGGRYVF